MHKTRSRTLQVQQLAANWPLNLYSVQNCPTVVSAKRFSLFFRCLTCLAAHDADNPTHNILT